MKKLFIYRISQSVNNDYDTYDSAIVVSDCEDNARKIHPSGNIYTRWNPDTGLYDIPWFNKEGEWMYNNWAYRLKDVKVEYIGIASDNYKEGDILCASFNAG